jgi:ABC-type multidrug transport system ATPase subunit
MAAEGAIHG